MRTAAGRSSPADRQRPRRARPRDARPALLHRRTRDPEEVSIAWQIDAYRFELPLMAAPMDSVVSPQTRSRSASLGGLGVLNLEGLWTRYDDPAPMLAEIAELPDGEVTPRMQELYASRSVKT